MSCTFFAASTNSLPGQPARGLRGRLRSAHASPGCGQRAAHRPRSRSQATRTPGASSSPRDAPQLCERHLLSGEGRRSRRLDPVEERQITVALERSHDLGVRSDPAPARACRAALADRARRPLRARRPRCGKRSSSTSRSRADPSTEPSQRTSARSDSAHDSSSNGRAARRYARRRRWSRATDAVPRDRHRGARRGRGSNAGTVARRRGRSPRGRIVPGAISTASTGLARPSAR